MQQTDDNHHAICHSCGTDLPFSVSSVLPQERGSSMGKLEPISPVSPAQMDPDLDPVPSRFSKEELIQSMDRVDREINMVELQICKLRKKQVCNT